MPFISEAASAIKTRFGFQNSSESVRATPDISKSTSRENLSQSSTVSSFNDVDEGRAGNSEIAVRSFDLPEDPAFWKDHSVQVIIRTRPLSSSEISLQGDNRCVRQESYQTIAWTGHPESRFTFDLVADENVTQEKLFKVVGIPMVENCMIGYNSCMFAYGQTGSGKTHTMLGDIEGGTRRHSVNCGMTPRVFEYLFSRIQKEKEARRDEKLRFTCKCSFLEIYNEQILDLLNPSSVNLQIREDLKKGVYVEGLTESEVTCAREVLQQLIQGSANRKVAATNMNRASSRSHSVFTCVIESTWDSQGVTHHRFARLNLVDLAGSERQKSSGAEGERFKEATNINKSLSTLGLVIMNLVSISNGKSLHVPYRDSKLTFLLQDSLGGNSKTTIIANISPSNCSSLETLSTLKFAQRAKFIKNNAIVNEDASGDVLVMRMQIQQLKKEVSRLRGIVNGGAENQDDDTLSLGFPGSPESFKWEGLCGTFSPFNSDRKASQKEYEVALVGAFKREKDKDLALQALATENQAAMQLAKQREDEIRGLKMRLRFREAGIKRVEAMASGKISAETHFLKEKEEHLKEIEVLRAQVDRNQEVTRFAMENLRLKEEIRRLKSFCEEGERERMNEQIMVLQNKLLEALDWKFMHESDPSAIQKGSPGLLTEGHHNSEQSKEEQASPRQASINEVNELFHLQAIQNQAEMDFLRKKLDLCMEEKQKLERHIKELETEVEIMRSSKPMEKTQKVESDIPERANDMYSISFNDQMELKAMVDAIAAASEREAEAHEVAISLSKKNDELQSKVKVLLQENNKLIDLYERAIADQNNSSDRIAHGGGNEIQNTTSFDAKSDDKDMESKKLEDLEHQLMEMHEENEKLMGLYEKAMQERDEFKRMLSSRSDYDVNDKGEFNCPEKLVVVDGGEYFESDELAVNTGECMQLDEPSFNGGEQISEENDVFRWNMQNDSDQFLETARPTEEIHMDLNSDQSHDNFTGESFYEPSTTNLGPPFSRETGLLAEDTVFSQFSEMDGSGKYLLHSHDNPDKLENVRITSELEAKKELALVVKMKLDEAQEKLSNSAQNVNEFGFLEKAILDVGELSRVIEGMKDLIHLREQELESHKLFSSEMQEKSALTGRKLLALKYALSNFSSPIAYFEQREVRARARVDASKSYANQKREDLARLQAQKDEIEAARNKIQEGEIELRNNLAYLKSKLEEENQRQENQKVLFSLDNVERAEIHLVHKSGKHGCKATELLKSEEEKTKLLNEIKHSRDKLGIMKKEIEDLNKNSQKAENKIRGVSMEVHKASKDVEEMELALNNIAHEKEILLEIGEDGKTQIDNMIIEYQECLFAAYLKEEESKILEEEMQRVLAELERLQTEKAAIINRTSQLLHGRECHAFSLSDNMQEVLEDVGRSILEAKLLLEQGS